MPLPKTFRVYGVNRAGAEIEFGTDGLNNSLILTAVPWKYSETGAITYGSEITIISDPTSDLADGASVVSSTIDNSSNKWLGLHCTANLTTDATVSGRISFYMEFSTDGGTTWPTDADDTDETTFHDDLIFIGSIKCTSTDPDRGGNFVV